MQPSNNNEVLPIEKQKIKDYIKHVQVVLPALDEKWITQKQFIYYTLPPTKFQTDQFMYSGHENWLSGMTLLLDDIWWLCELQYHKFWSQIIYDPGAMNGIRSFLHLAPLQELYFKIEDIEILLMYKRVKKAIFQFLRRLLRTKESKLHFMSPEKYKEIMCRNNLLPVSFLFCLCSLFGRSERQTIISMIANLIQYNESFKLEEAVLKTVKLFGTLKTRLQKSYVKLKGNMKYSDNVNDVREATNSYRQNLYSCVQCLTNVIHNISCLLSVYKEGCDIFLSHNFDFHILRVYKKLITPIYNESAVLFDDDRYEQTYSKLNLLLSLSRLDFISTFYVCLDTLLERLNVPALRPETFCRYVQLIKLASKNEEFLMDLERDRSFNEFHEKFKKKCPDNVDLIELDRVYDVLREVSDNVCVPQSNENSQTNLVNGFEDEVLKFISDDYNKENGIFDIEKKYDLEDIEIPADDCSSDYSDWDVNENSDSEYEAYLEENEIKQLSNQLSNINLDPIPSTSTDPIITVIDLQSAISQTKDLLPHLGEGFIAMCLKHYRMNVAAVINSILENSLPSYLQTIDFALPDIPKDILQEITREKYKDQDKLEGSGLKEFKRVDYTSYKDMLNDKKEVIAAKKIYEQYRNIEEDEIYNDDVDEDYEDMTINPVEVEPEGFSTEYGNIVTHNPNRVHEIMEEQSELEEDIDDERLSKTGIHNEGRNDRFNKTLDFCENPEDVRARREHHYRITQERRYKSREFRNSGRKPPESSGSNEQRERHKKNVHKATNANHNRKFMSDRKKRI